MTSSKQSVLVVGSGIIGLVSAFRLAQRGHEVTLLDPEPAKGATWAAAGMVAPSAEIAPGEESNYQLQLGALPSWREVASMIYEITGRSMTIEETGTLVVGWDASDRRLVDQYTQVAEQFGAPLRRVTRTSDEDMFQGVSPRISEGVLLEGDAWIDPDQAVRLLLECFESLGGKIVGESVLSVSSDERNVSVRTESQTLHADKGLICTGWSGLPEGLTSPAHRVRPIRGVTVRVRGIDRATQPIVRAFVRGRAFYMVSRPGGYCVLGATAEEKSEPIIEVGELQRLLRDALDIVPSLEGAPVLETRIGLRPATPDLEPFFERMSSPRWAWCSGHYRHGVTLAPIAAGEALSFVEESA